MRASLLTFQVFLHRILVVFSYNFFCVSAFQYQNLSRTFYGMFTTLLCLKVLLLLECSTVYLTAWVDPGIFQFLYFLSSTLYSNEIAKCMM